MEFCGFRGLLVAFTKAVVEALDKKDVQVLRDSVESFASNTDHDKKSPMDQAFREVLLFRICGDVQRIGDLLRLSVEAVRIEIVTVTIPVVLLGDIFDCVTLDKCERIFEFVEEMVEVWKEEIFFSSCKNNILRMCNDLLRRLSRAQNTVFCGRILLFLSKFFPFSERSGLNIVSEFNLDNVTEYGVEGKDQDDTLDDAIEDIPIKIDYNLYCKFWSLQDFFRNPNQCYSKAQWKMFQAHASTVLEAFSSFKLEEPRSGSKTRKTNVKEENAIADIPMEVDFTSSLKMENSADADMEAAILKTDHFFAKYLTNPKLLALQLSDTNFRRSVLVQFLILFQYLQLPVKFKTDSNTLTTAQTEFIKDTVSKVYRLIEETPPNGKRFMRTVQHMLSREEMWNNWKNDGCKDFKRPGEMETSSAKASSSADGIAKVEPAKLPSAKRPKRPLGDCLRDANRNNKFFLGNDALTRLWNHSADNLQACKSEERNFLPQVDTFLENPQKNDASYEWRALRLLARQSPYFFPVVNTSSSKISDYLENVRKRLLRDKQEAAKTAANMASNGPADSKNSTESNETETMALQEQEAEQEGENVIEAAEDVQAELEKATTSGNSDGNSDANGDDDKNAHVKPMTATREQIEQIAPFIGDEWKKLGKKIGHTPDELLYFETEHPDSNGGCIAMLVNWFADDDDASLENWAYILEGLEINEAAREVKALIECLSPPKLKTDANVEIISD